VFIEIKISNVTELTANQPKGYIKALEKNDTEVNKALLFLIPNNYKFQHEIYEQATTLISKSNKKIGFGFLYWEPMINKIRNSGIGELNDIFKHFIDLLELWFSLKMINFTKKEIDMLYEGQVISTLTKLMDIVKSLNSKLATYDRINVRMSRSSEEYSLYIKDSLNDTEILYFGIWYEAWRKTNSPLCLAVSEKHNQKDIVSHFRNYLKGKFTSINDWLVYSIERDEINMENSIEVIYTKIITYLKSFFGDN